MKKICQNEEKSAYASVFGYIEWDQMQWSSEKWTGARERQWWRQWRWFRSIEAIMKQSQRRAKCKSDTHQQQQQQPPPSPQSKSKYIQPPNLQWLQLTLLVRHFTAHQLQFGNGMHTGTQFLTRTWTHTHSSIYMYIHTYRSNPHIAHMQPDKTEPKLNGKKNSD